ERAAQQKPGEQGDESGRVGGHDDVSWPDQAATAGRSTGCGVRKPTAMRFQTLMAPMAMVSLVICSSLKNSLSGAKSASGARVVESSVSASVQPRTARSSAV